MIIQKATQNNLTEILDLFKGTIQASCSNDYTSEQIAVWVSSVENHERWKDKILNQYFLIALEADKIVGFGSLENGNYLDFLYVHKDHQRKGVANSLYEALEREAINQQSTQIISDVSITAKPFFIAQGFKVIEKQEVIRQNTSLINYKMIKTIADARATNS